jgi:hypothetical protein
MCIFGPFVQVYDLESHQSVSFPPMPRRWGEAALPSSLVLSLSPSGHYLSRTAQPMFSAFR